MSTKSHRLFPHGELRQLAPNLWIVRGGLPFPIYRNMVVYRLLDGRLVLHSLVALSEAGMQELEALGQPAILIVPNGYDGMDAPWYFQRYPQATFLTPDEERARVEALGVKISDDPARVLPALGFKLHKVVGLKFTEYVLEAPVDGGTALMCNNLLDHRGAAAPGCLGRLMDVATMSGGKLAPGRMLRAFMVKDEATFKGFLATLPTIPRVKIVTMSHGDPVVDGDITAQLQRAAGSGLTVARGRRGQMSRLRLWRGFSRSCFPRPRNSSRCGTARGCTHRWIARCGTLARVHRLRPARGRLYTPVG